MLYKPGDRVLYGIHGVCEIRDVELKRIEKKNIEYYVLSPVRNAGARFYIPTQNEKTLSKLCPLITADELNYMLIEHSKGEDLWIEDENVRKQRIKEVISSGNNKELIQWVRTMHIHRRLLVENGKKFHQVDEIFLKDAEKLLTTEFAIIWNISEDSVRMHVEELIA